MIFSVTSTQSVGCTFVDWSIHWLSGATEFYNTNRGRINLTNSPLNRNNAHGHNKNHPKGFDETEQALSLLKLVEQDNFAVSLYPTPIKTHQAIARLGIDRDQIYKYHQAVDQYVEKDFALIWDLICKQTKSIYIAPTTNPTYFLSLRAVGSRFADHGIYDSIDEVNEDYVNVFFKESSDKFGDEPWERREFLALNMRLDEKLLKPKVDFTLPHLYIDTQELWYNGPNTITKIMQYLEIDIDYDRWENWSVQYLQWQETQINLLEFGYNYEHIAEAIVKNYFYSIPPLTLEQEAAILHLLMTKYDLNIRGWELVSFPDNTQDLHKLLEKNRHRIQR